jgi:hypothetical protein
MFELPTQRCGVCNLHLQTENVRTIALVFDQKNCAVPHDDPDSGQHAQLNADISRQVRGQRKKKGDAMYASVQMQQWWRKKKEKGTA